MTAALEGGQWSAGRPGRILPPGNTRYPLYRRLGGPQGRSGRAEKVVPTGIRSRTVQPIVSRYTNWATRPTDLVLKYLNRQYNKQYRLKRSEILLTPFFKIDVWLPYLQQTAKTLCREWVEFRPNIHYSLITSNLIQLHSLGICPPSCLIPSDHPTKIFYAFLISSCLT